MNWDSISEQLSKKLDPKHIKPAPRGKFGDYIEGHHAISEANRIFGYGGWSYDVTRLELVSRQIVTITPREKPPFDQMRIGYLASVRVTVDGITREGCAVGSGVGNPDTEADLHESAIKEAETDALKRALRTFGNPFGLALYDTTKADIGVDEPSHADIRDRIKAAVEKSMTQQQLRALWSHHKTQDAVNGLPDPMQLELNTAYNDKWNSLPDDPTLQDTAA